MKTQTMIISQSGKKARRLNLHIFYALFKFLNKKKKKNNLIKIYADSEGCFGEIFVFVCF